MAKPLSRAARAVLNVVLDEAAPVHEQCRQREDVAAIIRALVEQAMPEPEPFNICAPMTPVVMRFDWEIRRLQLAIAAELEGQANG